MGNKENCEYKSKIAVITPYYGCFPNYFQLWLKSVELNESIDFFLITDMEVPFQVPDNVHVIRKSFAELKGLIQGQIDFKIKLNSYYKLCDYKPVWGLVLRDLLKQYDFWGYCDCDLIFGDIRVFITDEILNDYDVILTHGHFMLFRNTDEINRLFLDTSVPEGFDYKETFKTNYVTHFDEHGGMYGICVHHKLRMYDENIFADISFWKKQFQPVGRDENGQIGYYWNRGNLVEYSVGNGETSTRNVMYCHFQKRNMSVQNVENCGNITEFTIIPNSFLVGEKISNKIIVENGNTSHEYEKKQKKSFKKRQVKRIFQGAICVRASNKIKRFMKRRNQIS